MIFIEKDEVILAVLRGRRNKKHTKDTLTASLQNTLAVLHKIRYNGCDKEYKRMICIL